MARGEAPRSSAAVTSSRREAGWAPVQAARPPHDSTVTTRVQTRLTEKARMRRRRRRNSTLRWLGIVLAVMMAGWALSESALFALQRENIEVTGYGTVVSRTEVEQVLEPYEGSSLVLMDAGGLTAQLEALHGVREAKVQRVWPAALQIELISREPVAAIPSDQDGFVLVDQDGVEVGAVEERPEALPVISVPLGADHVRVLNAVLTVVAELPVELRDSVGGIEAQTEDSVTFTLRDGPRVEWGSAEESALKAEVLRAMLNSAQAADVAVIDVSAPTLPITRSQDD